MKSTRDARNTQLRTQRFRIEYFMPLKGEDCMTKANIQNYRHARNSVLDLHLNCLKQRGPDRFPHHRTFRKLEWKGNYPRWENYQCSVSQKMGHPGHSKWRWSLLWFPYALVVQILEKQSQTRAKQAPNLAHRSEKYLRSWYPNHKHTNTPHLHCKKDIPKYLVFKVPP